MHLWQIRHIPNHRQTLLKLTFAAAVFSAAVATLWPAIGFVAAQTAEAVKEPPEAAQKASAASEFLQRVRQELLQHQSVKAKLNQVVSIGDQQFKVGGDYVSSGEKLMLNYTVTPDQGAECRLLEVCDGNELWTMLQLPDSKRVTHRNIRQILAAAAEAKKNNVPETTLNIELGLGGISTLLASLEKTMVFDKLKENSAGEHPRTTIQGRWKPEFAANFRKEKDDSLPPFVPDLVHIHVNSKTLFPEKMVYWKKQPQKQTFKPLVTLEFREVEFDAPVDDAEFVFTIPPGAVPEDVTKFYLDRFAVPGATPPPVN